MKKQNLPETLTLDTLRNMRDVLNQYYDQARVRCEADAARNVAINRLKSDIEEYVTNWEYIKS